MSSQNFSDYPWMWMFTDSLIPIPAVDLAQIKPLTPDAAIELWRGNISRRYDHPMCLSPHDWLSTWQDYCSWQSAWNGDSPDLPDGLADNVPWQGADVVHFAYHRQHIIGTTWKVFKSHWKNFLFEDEGPILFSEADLAVIQFLPDGTWRAGQRRGEC